MACECSPPDRRLWRVTEYKSNRSYFSRGRNASSPYSECRCLRCGFFWRTKAAYVETLARAEGDEGYRLGENDHDRDGNSGPKAIPLTREEQVAQQRALRDQP